MLIVTMPTRVTDTTESLLDVMLTIAKPQYYKACGVYNPEVSDRVMVYGLVTEKVKHHRKLQKLVSFMDLRT